MVLQRRESLVLLTESSVAVALSVLLGTIRLLTLPNGGSITLAALPLLALALSRGSRVGIAAGCCAGIAHALSGGTIVHPAQLGLDYLTAYAVLSAAGLAAGRGASRAALAPAILFAMVLHLAAMVLSGIVFFAPVAGSAALAYSLAYNASTVVPEALLALWLAPPLLHALARANPADAWRRGLATPAHRAPRAPRRYRPIHATGSIDTSTNPTDIECRSTPHAPTPRPVPASLVAARSSFVRPAPFAPRRARG